MVTDWRDGDNEWSINLTASRIEQVGGNYTLPEGTLGLNRLETIERKEGSGSGPSMGYQDKAVLDGKTVKIVSSEDSRGVYGIKFPINALELYVDPTVMLVGEYKTTLTWELVTAP